MGKESGLMGNTFLGFLMFPAICPEATIECFRKPWDPSLWRYPGLSGLWKPFTPGLEAQLLVVNHSTLTIEEEIFDEGKQTDPRQ